jgi:thiol-disulfide isomerase/thioredoxin
MFLTPGDFSIKDDELILGSPKNQKLGYFLVFFFTRECVFCRDVEQAFSRLANFVRGVNFVKMDVAQNNWAVRDLANRTKTPITYVPLIVLFSNGKQIGRFSHDEEQPNNNFHKLKKFIVDITTKNANEMKATVNSFIPDYTIGRPGNHAQRRVCKLYNEAYPNRKK